MSVKQFALLISLGFAGFAPMVAAEQYRYQDDRGQFVITQEHPPEGTSYAVLDDNGVYQYLVHATALLMPRIEWQLTTIDELADEIELQTWQAPLVIDGAGGGE